MEHCLLISISRLSSEAPDSSNLSQRTTINDNTSFIPEGSSFFNKLEEQFQGGSGQARDVESGSNLTPGAPPHQAESSSGNGYMRGIGVGGGESGDGNSGSHGSFSGGPTNGNASKLHVNTVHHFHRVINLWPQNPNAHAILGLSCSIDVSEFYVGTSLI